MSEWGMRISHNIEMLRTELGTDTDEYIAGIIGCSVSTVNKKMNGHNPWRLEEIEKLAQTWKMDPSELTGPMSFHPSLAATGTEGRRVSRRAGNTYRSVNTERELT